MNRLITIANLISGSKLNVDIGCDHCLLCKYCIENNFVTNFINIDINKKPLSTGIKNIKPIYLENVKFIQNDGLKDIYINNIDSITISGLGGNSIVEILENNKNNFNFAVVQPNNNIYLVRKFLMMNNYKIINEILIKENNIFYIIIKFIIDKTNIISDIDIYLGPILKNQTTDPLTFEYFNNKLVYYEKIINNTNNNDIILEYDILKKWVYKYGNDKAIN